MQFLWHFYARVPGDTMMMPSLMQPLTTKSGQRHFLQQMDVHPVSRAARESVDYVRDNPSTLFEVALIGSGAGNIYKAAKMTRSGVRAIRAGSSSFRGFIHDKQTRTGIKAIRRAGALKVRGKVKISLAGGSYFFDIADRLGL